MQKVIENLLKQISKDAVIIGSKSILDIIIKYSGGLYSYRLKSFNDIKSDILRPVTTYDILNYAIENNTTYELAKILIEEASRMPIKIPSLSDLYDIKTKYLKEIDTTDVIEYYRNTEVVFIDYYHDDDNINNIISLIDNGNIKYLYLHNFKDNYINKVTKYHTYYDEVMGVVNEINKYINESNYDIVINTLDDEYMIVLKEALKIYNLSYNMKDAKSVYTIKFTKDIIDEVFDMMVDACDVVSCFNKVIDTKLNSNMASKIIKSLSNTLESLSELNLSSISKEDLKRLVIDVIKDSKVNLKDKKEARIKIENVFNNTYDSNTLIFVLNFNQDVIPKTIKDDKYISDEAVYEINSNSSFKLLSSVEKNIKRKKKYLDYIRTNQIHLSYSLKTPSKELVPSSLIHDLGMSVNVINNSNNKYEINNKENIFINYKKAVDSFNLYKLKNENLNVLSYLMNDVLNEKLSVFDPSFKGGITLNSFPNLSFTNLSDFLSCSYMFYLKYILKIKKEEFETNSSLSLKTGNMFHHILETFNKPMTEDEIYDEVIKYANSNNYTLNNKELVYLKKFVSEFKITFEDILKFEKDTKYQVYAKEKWFGVDLSNDMKFVGKVDKIYNRGDFYSVVDYKTKDVSFDLKAINQGIDLQLPFYVYLIKKCINNSDIQGIYLQSILRSSEVDGKEMSANVSDYIKTNNRLTGVINLNRKEVEEFDPNFDNSDRMYKSAVVKSGYVYTSNFEKANFESEDFTSLYKYMDKVINDSSDKIAKSKFDINPFTIASKHDSCTYCIYKDICFIKSYLKKEREALKDSDEVKDFLRSNYGNKI